MNYTQRTEITTEGKLDYPQYFTKIQYDPWTYLLQFLFYKVYAGMNPGVQSKAYAEMKS